MKSVIGMFIIAIVLGIIAYSDILGFFTQKNVLLFLSALAVGMLILAFLLLGSPFKNKSKRGDGHDKV